MSLADAVNQWYADDPLWGNMLIVAFLTAIWALVDAVERVVLRRRRAK
jgi:hypothetical protein